MATLDVKNSANQAIKGLGKILKRKVELEKGEFSGNENVRSQTRGLMKTDLELVKDEIRKLEEELEK